MWRGLLHVAIDGTLDAAAVRLRVDEHDEVEFEPLRQFRVSQRTRDVAPNALASISPAPMTQAMPSGWVASHVSRIEPRSDASAWTTGRPLLRIEVGTLASGSAARMTGSAFAMTSAGVR